MVCNKKHEKKLSPKAQALYDSLSSKEKEQIKKEYFFPNVRNALIRKLRKKGATYLILSEIVGVSQTSIEKLVKSPKKNIQEQFPILKVDYHPVLMLVINDLLREKFASSFKEIEFYPQDYQDTAIKRFLLVQAFEIYFVRASKIVLGEKFRRKPLTIDYCENNNVPINTFYRWQALYPEFPVYCNEDGGSTPNFT